MKVTHFLLEEMLYLISFFFFLETSLLLGLGVESCFERMLESMI